MGKRQTVCRYACALNAEFGRRPIDIVERQRSDFTGTQSQAGE
jgi:hypothetical protein